MTSRALVLRGLQHYWRTNLAVVAGVATAVAVLAGALLVGDSVRGSLRDLVLQRLGRTDRIVVATNFFREALADDLRGDADFTAAYTDITPLIVMQALVTEQDSGRRASRVQVYGVDDRFWRFHHVAGRTGPADREAFLSRALAADWGNKSIPAMSQSNPGNRLVERIFEPVQYSEGPDNETAVGKLEAPFIGCITSAARPPQPVREGWSEMPLCHCAC